MNHVSEHFHEALNFVSRLHETQYRKGNHVPYISHLLNVASLVLKCEGSEQQAIAALLHDSLEDQGDKITVQQIEYRFGSEVKNIVVVCTDHIGLNRKTIPWRERKEKYLEHLPQLSSEEMLVVIADKLDNSLDLKRNYHQIGDEIWSRFSGNKQGLIWYQCELVKALQKWSRTAKNNQNPYIPTLIEEFELITQQLSNPL